MSTLCPNKSNNTVHQPLIFPQIGSQAKGFGGIAAILASTPSSKNGIEVEQAAHARARSLSSSAGGRAYHVSGCCTLQHVRASQVSRPVRIVPCRPHSTHPCRYQHLHGLCSHWLSQRRHKHPRPRTSHVVEHPHWPTFADHTFAPRIAYASHVALACTQILDIDELIPHHSHMPCPHLALLH